MSSLLRHLGAQALDIAAALRPAARLRAGAVRRRDAAFEREAVGIGTTVPVTRLHVAGGNTALPATTGKTQSAGHSVRLRGNSTQALDMGSAAAKGHWIQSTDLDNLATNYPLLLNPNGGHVGLLSRVSFSA